MANVVYSNAVIADKATELLTTKVNARSLMTIDTSLAETAGMKKTINTYTYSGEAEALAVGVGNTTNKRGSISYVGKDYTVLALQQAFDYYDEDAMKEDKIVGYMSDGATQVMANKLTADFYTALETTDGATSNPKELVGKTEFAKDSTISYSVIADAIGDNVLAKAYRTNYDLGDIGTLVEVGLDFRLTGITEVYENNEFSLSYEFGYDANTLSNKLKRMENNTTTLMNKE